MNNQRDTFLELRSRFDGQDPFMTGGHQIIKPRTGNRETPEWAKSDKKVQALLLRSFPKLKTNARHRAGASRWAVIIQLYFRMHMTRGRVAEETKLPQKTVINLIDCIHRVSKDMKANGKGPRSRRKIGRPKKS